MCPCTVCCPTGMKISLLCDFAQETSVKSIDWFNKQERQGLCSEEAEFRSHLVNRKGRDQNDKPKLDMLEISKQNSNRMGLSPLCRLPYL